MSVRKIVVSALLCASVHPALAAESSIADQIREINENIALLSAKKQELELKAQLAAKQAEMSKLSGGGVPISGAELTPVVRGIEGIDGKLTATLAFGGGMQQTVKQGEKIHGGWTVAEIAVNSVTLARGSERVRLGFGSEPPAAPSSAGGAGGPYPAPGISGR